MSKLGVLTDWSSSVIQIVLSRRYINLPEVDKNLLDEKLSVRSLEIYVSRYVQLSLMAPRTTSCTSGIH